MKLSELSTTELLEKARNEIRALCGSRGVRKDWRMTIPVDEDQDSDVLFGEVLRRLAKLATDNERLREVAVAYQKKIDDDCASNGCLCTFRGVTACSEWIAKALRGE